MGEMGKRSQTLLTLDEYLEMDRSSTIRYEFVAGKVHPRSGSSAAHNGIAVNVLTMLRIGARGSSHRVFISDMKLKVSDQVVYYPDIFVTNDPADDDPYVKSRPCLVVEIASPVTEAVDRREKYLMYSSMPSLNAYVVLFENEVRAIVRTRDEYGIWWESEPVGSGSIRIPAPEVELRLADIYEGIRTA